MDSIRDIIKKEINPKENNYSDDQLKALNNLINQLENMETVANNFSLKDYFDNNKQVQYEQIKYAAKKLNNSKLSDTVKVWNPYTNKVITFTTKSSFKLKNIFN